MTRDPVPARPPDRRRRASGRRSRRGSRAPASGSTPPGRAKGWRCCRAGFDAVLLDVMLPEMDGFEVCRPLRAESDVPMIMLTARGDVMDRVVGLELGADDYLPKPFEPRELLARLQTVLRRQRGPGRRRFFSHRNAGVRRPRRSTWIAAACGVHRRADRTDRHRVRPARDAGAGEPGKVFGRDDLLTRLRGHEADLYTRAIDIVVSRLRKKLEPLDCIKTLRNAGYSLGGRARNDAAQPRLSGRFAGGIGASAASLAPFAARQADPAVPAVGAGDEQRC